MSAYNEAEWRRIYSLPGSIAVCDSPSWLLNGCPKCGCKTWQVTSDYWAYCDGCLKGYPTSYPFTGRGLAHFDQYGEHCFMCDGYGTINGERCEECGGHRTQPESESAS